MFSINPTQQSYWDWRVAGNFVFGGTGTGILVFTFLNLAQGSFFLPTLGGLAVIALGLFLVWTEIGRPFRFLNVLRNPWTSWMSREAWAAGFLFAAGLAALVFEIKLLLGLSALFALAFLFSQAKMLVRSRGIPAWREPAILPLVLATGLCEGAAALLIFEQVWTHSFNSLAYLVALLVMVRAICYRVYSERLKNGGAPTEVCNLLKFTNIVVYVPGTLIPLGLLAAAYLAPAYAAPLLIFAGLPALVAGWELKFRIVCRMGHVQGMALKRAPQRGAGKSGAGAQPGWN
ncbi:MAG: hypothetical protein K8F25_15795 [Fimbriimonadaceae bacterium]|nr:hypothetical protein [Alphaproteobacteria bacterium]